MVKTRRDTRGPQAPPANLADTSKQYVDNLLHRVNLRNAGSKRAQGKSNSNSFRRGKQNVGLEAEDSIFHQAGGLRGSNSEGHRPPDSLKCGAPASTSIEDVYKSNTEADRIVSSDMTKIISLKERNIEEDRIAENHGHKLEENLCCRVYERHDPYSSLANKDRTGNIIGSCLEQDEFDWEVGSCTPGDHIAEQDNREKGWTGEFTIEVEDDAITAEKQGVKRTGRRATAKDKEFAELVHKSHLLCLLGRGRLIDSTCDDPLLQASLISLLPPHVQLTGTEQLTTAMLEPVVKWFQSAFRICSDTEASPSVPVDARESLLACFTGALARQSGTAEEVTALSVALFRALGATARYVTVLDVASLKPDGVSLKASADWDSEADGDNEGLFPQLQIQTNRAMNLGRILAQCVPQFQSPEASFKSPDTNSSKIDMVENQSPDLQGRKGRSGRSRGRSKIVEGKRLLDDSSVPSCSEFVTSRPGQRYSRGHVKRGVKRSLMEATEDANSAEIDSHAALQDAGRCSKRKGDEEFELQLAMAMAATAVETNQKSMNEIRTAMESGVEVDELSQPSKCASSPAISLASSPWQTGNQQKQDTRSCSSSKKMPMVGCAVWSRKRGPLLHWCEIYCGGDGADGRWVHVDAGRGILDGANVVEGAATACKFPLRYVVAFAGNGAKDVTRRYVSLWSTVAPLRVDIDWWNFTLAPLKELEAAATSGKSVYLWRSTPSGLKDIPGAEQKESTMSRDLDVRQSECTGLNEASCYSLSAGISDKTVSTSTQANDRSSIEDMELEVRAYTEPLPTSQQAYKNHHLYVLEKWLTKYQTLYPRGPILGYCAGQPVFPRTCVQELHTAERWLREGQKVKHGETPAKIVRNSRLANKEVATDADVGDDGDGKIPATYLFGRWQTESWQPPPAIGGIVPKNERGNVDVWSEKCLPLGTVHMRLPRLLPIATRLGIDFAPAMVGFEMRNRKSVPVFDGIVVCEEFADVLSEAYAEEEQRRTSELKKKRKEQAVSRWCQLLRSIAIRQRLRDAYEVAEIGAAQLQVSSAAEDSQNISVCKAKGVCKIGRHIHNDEIVNAESDVKGRSEENHNALPELQHQHIFPEENQVYDEGSGMWTKTCPCGFILRVEEM